MKKMNHYYRLFIFVLSILGLLTTGPNDTHAAQPKKKYNILFLFADDMRRDTIAALGNDHIQTPNLDQLVRQGTAFTRSYIMGSTSGAVCVPSRAMLMSGRTLFRTHHQLKGMTLLGEVMQQAGYVTFGTGKWHNGQASFARSFELSDAVYFGGMSDHFNVPASRPAGGAKFKRYDAKGTHSSELFANAAIDFLKNQAGKGKNKGKPFFLYVAFTAPHDPRDAPLKYRQMYYKNRPPLPKNFMPQHPFDNGHMVLRDEVLAAWPRTKEIIRDQLAEYYALITHMDAQIGRILQTLRESGEYENTIIVFAADHGLAIGSHGLLGKQNVYEHSVGMPLAMVGPGIPKDQRRDAFVYLLDMFPTLCEMNGIDTPKSVEGISFAGVITGKQAKTRETLYFNYLHKQRAVRDDRWKLICYPKINHFQLFDLHNDPHELTNLIDNPRQKRRADKLKMLLLNWEKKLGVGGMPLTTPNPQPKRIDLSGKARQPDRWQPEWIRKKYFGE